MKNTKKRTLDLIPNEKDEAMYSGKAPKLLLEVAGCDYHIGITLTLYNNFNHLKKGTEIVCMHGKNSPWRSKFEEGNPKYAANYDSAFNKMIKCIEDGEYMNCDINKWMEVDPFRSGRPKCAYKA